jgi:A/G-specific adenine glycosylase
VAAAIIWKDDSHVLIAQRKLDDMLGGLWEFPGGRLEDGESLAQCLRREIREELGLSVEVGELVTSVRHAYTHFRITLHAFQCRSMEGLPVALGCADWRWVEPADLANFAFPVADQKVIAALLAVGRRDGAGHQS